MSSHIARKSIYVCGVRQPPDLVLARPLLREKKGYEVRSAEWRIPDSLHRAHDTNNKESILESTIMKKADGYTPPLVDALEAAWTTAQL